jgi:hypothetical protein
MELGFNLASNRGAVPDNLLKGCTKMALTPL